MNTFLPFQHPSQVPSSYRRRIIVGTGHRPQKLGGYGELTRTLLNRIAIEWLRHLAPRGVISGLAQGWDSALIEACWALGLPYVACAPFKGQESKWPGAAQFRYRQYVERAAKFVISSPGEYSAQKMQIRNEHMIDMALKDGPSNALVIALWDGSTGGTKNCIDYAQRKQIEIINAWQYAKLYPEMPRRGN